MQKQEIIADKRQEVIVRSDRGSVGVTFVTFSFKYQRYLYFKRMLPEAEIFVNHLKF